MLLVFILTYPTILLLEEAFYIACNDKNISGNFGENSGSALSLETDPPENLFTFGFNTIYTTKPLQTLTVFPVVKCKAHIPRYYFYYFAKFMIS